MFPWYYVFNHIPKTAGNSVLAVCRENLLDEEISPHLWEHDFGAAPATCFEQYRLVRGHFSIRSQMGLARDRYSFTFLRHPIRTIVSAYEYGRTLERQYQNHAASMAKILSFSEYVRHFADYPAVIHNPYTYHFAVVPKDYPGSPDECALLANAKRNLQAFDFVGITEEFFTSAKLLCDDLGWYCPTSEPHENQSGSHRAMDHIDAETMAILLEHNQLDIKLYEFALATLRERWEHRGETLRWRASGRLPRSFNRWHPHGRESNLYTILAPPCSPQRRASIRRVTASWIDGPGSGTLEISIGFRVESRIETLVAGIAVEDTSGRTVFGTNTAIEKVQVANSPGCDCRASFVLQCTLPQGIYFVTPALHDLRDLGYHYHWIDKAARFEVLADDPPPPSDLTGIRLHRFDSLEWPETEPDAPLGPPE